jgi:hypothetical protein
MIFLRFMVKIIHSATRENRGQLPLFGLAGLHFMYAMPKPVTVPGFRVFVPVLH